MDLAGVVGPQITILTLPRHIVDLEDDAVHFELLFLVADCWGCGDRGDSFGLFQPVYDCRLPGVVQADHQQVGVLAPHLRIEIIKLILWYPEN